MDVEYAGRGRNASAAESVGTERVNVDPDNAEGHGSECASPSPMTMSTNLPHAVACAGGNGGDGVGPGGYQFGVMAGMGALGLATSPSIGYLSQQLQGGASPQPTRTNNARNSRKRYRRDRVCHQLHTNLFL